MYVKVLWFLFSFHLRVNETSYEQLTWNVAGKPFLGILGHRFPPTLIEFPQWGAIDLFVEADLLLWSTATVEVDESGRGASNKMKAIEMMMKGQHPVTSRVLSRLIFAQLSKMDELLWQLWLALPFTTFRVTSFRQFSIPLWLPGPSGVVSSDNLQSSSSQRMTFM